MSLACMHQLTFPALEGLPDVLDIIVIKDLAFPFTVQTVMDLLSNHEPVLITVRPSLVIPQSLSRYAGSLLALLLR